MRRAAAMLALVLAMAGGCASKQASVRPHDWQTYEPIGGWENYIPPRRDFEPSAARANAFSVTPQPSLVPLVPSGIALPAMGR